jgi:hypothetical protein
MNTYIFHASGTSERTFDGVVRVVGLLRLDALIGGVSSTDMLDSFTLEIRDRAARAVGLSIQWVDS